MTTQEQVPKTRTPHRTSRPERRSGPSGETPVRHTGDGIRQGEPVLHRPATPTGVDAPTERLQTPARRRPWKKGGRSIRDDYGLHLQLGFALALLLLWGLTFVDVEFSDDYAVDLGEQEVVQMEEVRQTRQETAPPPPPRPTAPIEVANDAVIDETRELDFDASLDLNEELVLDGPPAEAPPPEPNDEPVEEEYFVVVEEPPKLLGGLKQLQEQIYYPEMARKAGIEGRVIVQFIIDENGNVTSPTVVRGRHPLLDAEALRVIRQAKFTPGRQRNQPVKVQMALPITFQLAERK